MSNDIEQAKQFLAALREAGSIVWVDDEDCLLISPPFTAVEGYGDGEDLEGAIDRHYYAGAEFGVQRWTGRRFTDAVR